VLLFAGEHGYYSDPEVSALTVRRRTFRPAIARWQSPDPSKLRDLINSYKYCANDPVLSIDPSGLLSAKYVPVAGRNVKCRKLLWSHDWVLDDTETDGFILQRNVLWDFGIECGCKHWFRSSARCPPLGTNQIVDEDGCPDVVNTEGQVDSFEFWEIWVVKGGKLMFGKPPQLQAVPPDVDHDTIGFIVGYDACGTQRRDQYAYWYPGSDPPGGWGMWMLGGGMAGLLAWVCGNVFPAEIEEELSMAGPAVTKHTVRTFCCCPKDPEKKVDGATVSINGRNYQID
jgi:RHS repeat-associated protein